MAPLIPTGSSKIDPNAAKSEAGLVLYLITAFAAIGGFLFGYDFGVTSGVMAMPQFQAYFDPLTPAIKGALNSLMGCGAAFGCLVAGIMSDRFGRRDTIGAAALIFIVGGVLQCASHNIEMQLIGRFISGISVGACSVLSPMYNAELAPKEIRGRLIGFQQLMIDTGLLVSAWLDFGTIYINSDWSWRIPYLVQVAPAVLLAFCPFILPRSPRWLIEKGRTEEALDVLAYVHGKGDRQHPYVIQEFNEINDNVQLENNIAVGSYWEMIKDPKNRRVLWVGCSVAIFQQLTGANVIMYYAAFMFQQAGLKGSMSLMANGLDYAVMVIFCIPGMILVDRVGRVKLMTIGSIGMCACFFIIAGLYGGVGYTEWNEEQLSHVVNMSNNPAAGNAVIVFIFIFVAFYGTTWAPVAWIYIAEIFPLRIRSKGFALASAVLWVGNILVGQVTPILMDSITWGTYIIYGIIGIIMLVWMWLFAPEPKGLSLEEIEVVFHGPLVVTKINYEEYLSAHRDDVERIRQEQFGQEKEKQMEKQGHEDKDGFDITH
ncbi:glucose transporter [Choanephora cucurbitarum]|nr:glucose transporter [Choanephora cucurbitarum]